MISLTTWSSGGRSCSGTPAADHGSNDGRADKLLQPRLGLAARSEGVLAGELGLAQTLCAPG